MGIPCRVVEGRAESIPFPDESFDIVVTNSVMEHGVDIDACFQEISRVLAPGGLLWFETASSMSPFQNEIRIFPFFGWYPNVLKRRIMWWAARHRPEWVGHSAAPAVHWFSDRIAHTRLRTVGFESIVDRWAFRRDDEGGRFHAAALKLIRSNRFVKRIANILISECAYAALKGG
jgi:SAM-dependent methyltransferase